MFFSSNSFAQSFLKKLRDGELPTEKEQMKFFRNAENLFVSDSNADTALQLSIKIRDIIPLFDLQLSIKNGFDQLAASLIQAGAGINIVDKDGYTPTINAVTRGNVEILKMLINARADINYKAKDGTFALVEAAERGYSEIVRVLIDAGAGVNAVNSYSVTPLLWASEKGHDEIADMLVKAGADVNAVNSHGSTPLILAASNGHEAIANMLAKAGADVNAASNYGVTPLLWAAEKGHEAIANMLVKAGADVNAVNNHGSTPLILAANNGHEAIANMLAKAGADVNATNNYGVPPLILAAEHGYTDIVSLLLSRDADPDQRTQEGKTALSMARENGHVEAEKVLQAVTTYQIDMKMYNSKEWGVSFLYPVAWTVVFENDVSGSWSIPIAVGGAYDEGQRPVFMVNARRDEILSPLDPFVTVTQMLSDGSMVTVSHSPSEYMETSKKDLAKYFDGLCFKSASEIRLHGCIPASRQIYSYDSQGGRVTEMSVTVFCKGVSYQLICDMHEQKESQYIELFDSILDTVRIANEPININWDTTDDLRTYGKSDSRQIVADAFLAAGKQADQTIAQNTHKEMSISEQEISEAVDTLVNECYWHFSNVNNYSSMESEFARREEQIIRPIGKKLNYAGGMALMRKVYEQVETECGRSCRNALDMKWNRIGDWMS